MRKIALTELRVELSAGSAILNGRSSLPAICKLVAVERISHDAGEVARAQRRHLIVIRTIRQSAQLLWAFLFFHERNIPRVIPGV